MFLKMWGLICLKFYFATSSNYIYRSFEHTCNNNIVVYIKRSDYTSLEISEQSIKEVASVNILHVQKLVTI